ncbi:MAG: hypothetical protein IJ130_11995 [Solobacterium sp.]|nr:hypothetical protein [Solobacterium sp.]
MSHTSSKITEETVYQTYLSILRKEESRKLRDSFVRQKFGKIPSREKARKYAASEEYEQKLNQYFLETESMKYLFLPLEEQSEKIRDEYASFRTFIENDLLNRRQIRGYEHYVYAVKRKKRKEFLKTAGELVNRVYAEQNEQILKDIIVSANRGFRYQILYCYQEPNGWPSRPMQPVRLNIDCFPMFHEQMNLLFNIARFLHVKGEYTYIDTLYAEYMTGWMLSHIPDLPHLDQEGRHGLYDAILQSDIPSGLIDRILAYYTEQKVNELVSRNKMYRRIKQEYEEHEAREERLRNTILETIPERYIDMFPLARGIHRRFVIHVGPTNSGKTYDAVRRMVQTARGIYLAPLRLMAYEQYENIRNLAGSCTMLTGEEEIREEGSAFTASTIEMLNTSYHYECAVIDEAQMIGDRSRGGSWSAAMYGLYADEIQVCTAPEALDLLIRIIEDCNDEYTVVHHERFTPLIPEDTFFDSNLKDARKGDALIVFSRRNVHAVAAELQRMGRSVSIIYGALPYDVRHNEARRFAEGETDILVATDAIGMGMNLPIRRIVFLEMQKFDGYAKRFLTTSEILQIAGRAGRKGLYETGYVTVASERKRFRKLFHSEPKKIQKAYISFPDILLKLDCPLSETLERWKNMEVLEELLKGDIDDQIDLAKAAEAHLSDKELIYHLVMIPFDIRTTELWYTWMDFVRHEAEGTHCPLQGYMEHGRYTAVHGDIQELELEYRRMDLLYGYSRRITGDKEICEEISDIRQSLSSRIMQILSEQKLTPKKCRRCGKALPWNYPFNLCYDCYNGSDLPY